MLKHRNKPILAPNHFMELNLVNNDILKSSIFNERVIWCLDSGWSTCSFT